MNIKCKLNKLLNKKSFYINLFLSSVSIITPVLITDLTLKKLKLPDNNKRVMFISENGIKTDKKYNIRKYLPNSKYRYIGVYGREIEFDYFFTTDNNGFRESNNCKGISLKKFKNKSNNFVAFTGDSFTEGMGANISWTKLLQEKLCERNINSNNMAMAGYGIIDMKKTLEFSYKELNSRKAIIGIITDDYLRSSPKFSSNKYCSKAIKINSSTVDCSAPGPTWWHVKNNIKDEKIISIAEEKYKYGFFELLKPYLNRAKRKIKSAIKTIIPRRFLKEISYGTKADIFQYNKNATDDIISKYGKDNIIFVILPTKTERGLSNFQRKEYETINNYLSNLSLKTNVIDSRNCPLGKSHYHLNDGHLNTSGQIFIGKCIQKRIDDLEFF